MIVNQILNNVKWSKAGENKLFDASMNKNGIEIMSCKHFRKCMCSPLMVFFIEELAMFLLYFVFCWKLFTSEPLFMPHIVE